MPWGIAAGVVGSVAGAAVSSAMSPGTSGGSSGGSGGPSYYIPTGLGTADTTWQNLLNGAVSAQNGISDQLPYYGQSLNGGLQAGSTYAPGYENAASNAAQYYNGLGSTLAQQSNQNFNMQQALQGAGQSVFNLGLDPQSALYNSTLNQLQQQTGATNSMYGLGSSAAGAGVQNQALSNFNIDWQNNQLSRALQGLQGYGQIANVAGNYGQLASNQASQVPSYLLQAGQLPYTTGQTIASLPGTLAGQYASGVEQGPLSSASSIMSGIIPYMNYGQGAQSIPYQSQAAGAGAAGSMVSQGINTALGNYFGGSNYTGDFSAATPFSSSGFYDPTTFGPSGYGGGYTYGGSNSYGFTM
ncbi:hypothetical protein [Paraburkholderia acidiphila]|uniref:Uncharacterized protein n=1 Tax=Paraburkholderia acidiphila TaxID=2571747 RepID=A0A7Z2G3A6_9BURK|nr:hypothetical protein [Paraburkholderia acidiphila]QGZ54296.1 hypothetical protein FAZ97_04840 [Paraburkholderia acidiphila]